MDRRTAPRFPCSADGIDAATAEFEEFAQVRELPSEIRRDVVVSLDEMLSNVLKYAHDDDLEHQFSFRCAVVGGRLEVRLIYAGREFDPTAAPDPRTDLELEQRPIGGLGIFLVKSLMDDIEYHREGGLNHLVISKRIGSGEID